MKWLRREYCTAHHTLFVQHDNNKQTFPIQARVIVWLKWAERYHTARTTLIGEAKPRGHYCSSSKIHPIFCTRVSQCAPQQRTLGQSIECILAEYFCFNTRSVFPQDAAWIDHFLIDDMLARTMIRQCQTTKYTEMLGNVAQDYWWHRQRDNVGFEGSALHATKSTPSKPHVKMTRASCC